MSIALILTHSRDDCAPMVMEHFPKMGIDFERFNTDEFQLVVKLVLDLDSRGNFRGSYRFPKRKVNFEDVGVVWNRRIHEPRLGNELDQEPELKEWMTDESLWAMNISFTLFDAPVVNPLEQNERLKFNKWLQMKRAAELGLEIPDSRLTNETEAIREFWEITDHEMIFKKIRKGLFKMKDGRVLLVHTSKITEDKFNDEGLTRMRFCPMFLERHIPKKYDIRSVIVGERVFSVAIHSQHIPEGVVDYRTAAVHGKLNDMRHEQIELGKDIDNKLTAFTKSFGLAFSVIDLIETPEGRLVFLEDNPNGQWGWLEHKTKAPISLAFAEYLASLM